MALIVRRKLHEARLSEDWHEAEIADVTAEYNKVTPFGVKDQATIIFRVGEVELRMRCTLSLGKKAKLYGLITEITGQEPGKEFDLEELIGMSCKVLVSHREMESGDVWENIDRVKSVPQKSGGLNKRSVEEIVDDLF